MTGLEKERIISKIIKLRDDWRFLIQIWPGKTYSRSDILTFDHHVYSRYFECPEKNDLWLDAFFFDNGKIELSLTDGNNMTYFLQSVEMYNDEATINKMLARCYELALSIINGSYDKERELPWDWDEEE